MNRAVKAFIAGLICIVMVVEGHTLSIYADEQNSKSAENINKPVMSGDVTTWDCIWFGNYWQNTDSNGDHHVTENDTKDPIKWRVLDIDETGTALLLSDKLLDSKQFYIDGSANITWKSSTLRSFLNSYDSEYNDAEEDYSSDGFLNCAFTEAERNAIISTDLTKENSDYRPYGDTDTMLSLTEERQWNVL